MVVFESVNRLLIIVDMEFLALCALIFFTFSYLVLHLSLVLKIMEFIAFSYVVGYANCINFDRLFNDLLKAHLRGEFI